MCVHKQGVWDRQMCPDTYSGTSIPDTIGTENIVLINERVAPSMYVHTCTCQGSG